VRQLFIRLLSVFIYTKRHRAVTTSLVSPLDINMQTSPISSFFKIEPWEEPFDDYYKILYYFNIQLLNERNIHLYSTNLLAYLKIFIHNFSHTFKYPLFFNNYNFIYKRKVNFYKLCTLTKINNLKRLIFFKNKRSLGSSFFNYLRCFS